jgi:hypothetical protein
MDKNRKIKVIISSLYITVLIAIIVVAILVFAFEERNTTLWEILIAALISAMIPTIVALIYTFVVDIPEKAIRNEELLNLLLCKKDSIKRFSDVSKHEIVKNVIESEISNRKQIIHSIIALEISENQKVKREATSLIADVYMQSNLAERKDCKYTLEVVDNNENYNLHEILLYTRDVPTEAKDFEVVFFFENFISAVPTSDRYALFKEYFPLKELFKFHKIGVGTDIKANEIDYITKTMKFKLTVCNEEVALDAINSNENGFEILYKYDDVCKKASLSSLSVRIEFYMPVPKTQQLFYYYVSEPTGENTILRFVYPENKNSDYISFFRTPPINNNSDLDTSLPCIELKTQGVSFPGNVVVFSLADCPPIQFKNPELAGATIHKSDGDVENLDFENVEQLPQKL